MLNLDLLIVVGFLLITLLVGIGHGKKVTNIKEYALGGRNFSTVALVSTIVATWASGSGFLITLSKTYSEGLNYLFPALSIGGCFFIMARFLIPRMGEFLGKTSVAEAMGDLYGNKVRFITALAAAIGSAGSVAIQFKVLGNVFLYFFHLPSYVAIITAGLIVTIYSSMGGIRAITITDILQFFAFGAIIPLLGFLIWNKFYNAGFILSEVIAENPKFNLDVFSMHKNAKFPEMVILFLYLLIPGFSASAFQRIAMGKNLAQVQRAFLIAGAILILVKLLIAWIPFLIFSMNPNLENGKLLNHIIDNYSYVGLKGLIIVAIIAFAMSTADSKINSSTVLFVNDIYRFFVTKIKYEALASKSVAFFLGGAAIFLALYEVDLLNILLLANIFYYPVVTPVLIITILGFRSSDKSTLIGMTAGFCTTVMLRMIDIDFAAISHTMISYLLGMSMNLIFLFGSHYLLKQKGGWIKKTKSLSSEKTTPVKQKISFMAQLRDKGFYSMIVKFAPRNELTYTMMGIYFIIYTFTTVYSTQVGLLMENGRVILTFYQIMLVSGTTIAMYPIWPLSLKQTIKEKIIRIWWPIAIFYMLIFFNSFFVIFSDFNQMQFALFTINSTLAFLILGWQITLLLLPIGFYFAIICYKYFFNQFVLDLSLGNSQFIFIYCAFMLCGMLITFFKPQQEYLAATEEKAEILGKKSNHLSARVEHQEQEIKRLSRVSDVILNNVNHELRLPITGVINFSEMIDEQAQKLGDEYIQMLSRDLNKSSLRLSTMMLSMLDLATFNARKIKLKKEKFDISQMVRERIELCKKIYLEDKPIDFKLHLQSYLPIVGDKNYLMQVIDNLITNSINYSDGGVIDIRLYFRVDDMIEFAVIDEGKGISDDELESVFRPFKVGSRTSSPAGGRGLGLSLCKAVIESHGGSIRAFSRNKGAHISFLLPS